MSWRGSVSVSMSMPVSATASAVNTRNGTSAGVGPTPRQAVAGARAAGDQLVVGVLAPPDAARRLGQVLHPLRIELGVQPVAEQGHGPTAQLRHPRCRHAELSGDVLHLPPVEEV